MVEEKEEYLSCIGRLKEIEADKTQLEEEARRLEDETEEFAFH